MKHIFKTLLIASLAFMMSFNVNAQGKEVIDTGTIKQQLDYILTKSTTYQNYKVVRITTLNKFTSHVVDSLDKAQNQYKESLNTILSKKEEIDSLTLSLGKAKNKIEDLQTAKDSVFIFGKPINKASYNSMMWGLVLVLVGAIVLLFLLFKRSNKITSRLKSELGEIKDEFETHRKRSREREEKMARRHLDEILKYKNDQTSYR